jgi:hypothetical protein
MLFARLEKDRPFRFLGRRVLQVLADSATANLVLGRRTAPGRFLVVRVVRTEAEREEWEQQFAESRAAILKELEREVQAREIQTRTPLDLELLVVTDGGLRSEAGAALLADMLDPDQLAAARGPLFEEGEFITARRARTLHLETDPPDAQAYVDDRPVGVTPCRVEDLPDGEHRIAFSRPGYVFHESRVRVGAPGDGRRSVVSVSLEPEPAMAMLEVRALPPVARVTIGAETRPAPARWRLPAGRVEIRVEAPECEPRVLSLDLKETESERPHTLLVKL